MGRWLPENGIRKGIRRPSKIPRYVKSEIVDKVRQQVNHGLKTMNVEQQANRLADLRKQDDFCLIVLDACRYDSLKDEFGEYLTGELTKTKTVATNTFEYLQYNWPEQYSYPYVTAATPVTSEDFDFDGGDSGTGLPQEDLYEYYRGYVPNNHFQDLDEVWRDHWDDDLRVCPPEPTTTHAIERAADTSRMVVHYFQPHTPFIGDVQPDIKRDRAGIHADDMKIDEDIWNAVRTGEVSKRELREYYTANLRRVLAAASELIDQTDFDRYVIIGDHGEALGEFGRYAHSVEHPYVNLVPWLTVESTVDNVPEMWEYEEDHESDSSSTRERLQQLGYIE